MAMRPAKPNPPRSLRNSLQSRAVARPARKAGLFAWSRLMESLSSDLARRLAARAVDVCRHYLPNGKRVGSYWIAGDARGAKGRSLYVRLTGPDSGRGAAGKWSDPATGEHGDLLDLIAASCSFAGHRDACAEAQRFLGDLPDRAPTRAEPQSSNSMLQARRLLAASVPIIGTLAERYLASRGIVGVHDLNALRFHPRCFYRDGAASPTQYWPALIAAVTNEAGDITGVMRTWLARDGGAKAPVACPRKALGELIGNAVRFGETCDALIIGEGIETVLSLWRVLSGASFAAALSAQHLRAFHVPKALRRLYIVADRDDAGMCAAGALRQRARDEGVDARLLLPMRKDFNEDLLVDGAEALAATVERQLAPPYLVAISPRR